MGFKKFQKDFSTTLPGQRRPPGRARARRGQARNQALGHRGQARAQALQNKDLISLVSQLPSLPWFKFQHCQNLLDIHTVR